MFIVTRVRDVGRCSWKQLIQSSVPSYKPARDWRTQTFSRECPGARERNENEKIRQSLSRPRLSPSWTMETTTFFHSAFTSDERTNASEKSNKCASQPCGPKTWSTLSLSLFFSPASLQKDWSSSMIVLGLLDTYGGARARESQTNDQTPMRKRTGEWITNTSTSIRNELSDGWRVNRCSSLFLFFQRFSCSLLDKQRETSRRVDTKKKNKQTQNFPQRNHQ